MNRHTELERLFRETEDGIRRLIFLCDLKRSRPFFLAMNCRIRVKRLRELSDQLEKIAAEEVA